MIGDLFVIWEDLRSEARSHDCEESLDMREFIFWLWAWSGIAIGGMLLWKLWVGVEALVQISEKL